MTDTKWNLPEAQRRLRFLSFVYLPLVWSAICAYVIWREYR